MNAGKTGTTDNHADAWFDGYTRQLTTVVWMGYPRGEIPMLDVHGVEVAGATYPVPIWHEYMAAALWHRKALPFELPNKYPTWHYLTRGSYGSFGYYPTSTYSTTTTAPTTTTTVAPANPVTTTAAPKTPPHTTTVATPPPTSPPPPPAPTTTESPPSTTTESPPPSPGQAP